MSGPSPRLRAAVGRPVHFVVPAAGAGTRFGGTVPKQFHALAGRPLIAWTVERILRAGADSIVVVVPEAALSEAPAWFRHLPGLLLVPGGATRQASVALGLAASPAAPGDLVAVHDGARPAVAVGDLVAAAVAAAGTGVDGAVLGRDLSDTLKRVVDGRIVTTVERGNLFRAETPQIFARSTLERAFEAAAESRFVGTDEASLVERLPGARVLAIAASRPNPKVTTTADIALVEALLAGAGDAEAAGEWR